MKVLILLKHLNISGVTTFNLTLVREYKADYSIFVENKQEINQQLLEQFKNCGVKFVDVVESHYNLIFHNYSSNINYVKGIKGVHKFFVHGLMTAEYIPQQYFFNEIFVFGERAREYMSRVYDNVTMIRNFISKSGWLVPSQRIKKILLFGARQNNFLFSTLQEVCSKNNLYLTSLGDGQYTKSILNPIEQLAEADVVVGIGRCMLEAMEIGKPCLNFYVNGGDGVVTKQNFMKMAETNFSGWSFQKLKSLYSEINYKAIEEELLSIDINVSNINKKLINDHLNPNLFINKIVAI